MKGEWLADLTIGGVTKAQLRNRLAAAAVSLNAYAEVLFDAPEFVVSRHERRIGVVSFSLDDLGLQRGAPLPAIFDRARAHGYELCPVEVAPHLRLELTDQAPGPYLTVASGRLRSRDADFPAGFYLRRLEDGLWLRGYRTDDDWVFPPDFTRFVFALPSP